MKYRTILIDPPWPQRMTGKYKTSKKMKRENLPYQTMSLADIQKLEVGRLADVGCHLYLWTTNQFLETGFQLMQEWGFKYLAPIHWVRPSGMGNWFVHRTQTLLFGYFQKCQFNRERYKPNLLFAEIPREHSRKPEESYQLIESVSDAPRLEIFARDPVRAGWHVWGNEVSKPVKLSALAR